MPHSTHKAHYPSHHEGALFNADRLQGNTISDTSSTRRQELREYLLFSVGVLTRNFNKLAYAFVAFSRLHVRIYFYNGLYYSIQVLLWGRETDSAILAAESRICPLLGGWTCHVASLGPFQVGGSRL